MTNLSGVALIDGPNIANAAQSLPKLKVGESEVQAILGTLKMLRPMISQFRFLEPIVLWDGLSWRKSVYRDYKANRTKEGTKSAEKKKAERAALNKQLPAIRKGLEILGVKQVWAANYEADDLAAQLTRRAVAKGKRVQLVTGDHDWVQLVQPSVTWRCPINDRKVSKVTVENFTEVTGVADASMFVELKALMGDTGDNVPGVGGIGEKTAPLLLNEFGTVSRLMQEVELFHTPELDKRLGKRVIDFCTKPEGIANFQRNMLLVDLNHPQIPQPEDLEITKGQVQPALFKRFCERLAFQSILKDFDTWIEPFLPIEEDLAEAA